jgi:carotenoid cleavage dioxygenase-like enzyme
MDRVPSADTINRMLAGQPADYPPPILTRYTIDTRTGHIDERRLTDHSGDLPTINPARSARPTATSGRSPAPRPPQPYSTGILKVDTDRPQLDLPRLRPEPHRRAHVRAPPRRHRRGRRLAALDVLRRRTTPASSSILDAADLHTVARARMPIPTPLGFHGTWIPA